MLTIEELKEESEKLLTSFFGEEENRMRFAMLFYEVEGETHSSCIAISGDVDPSTFPIVIGEFAVKHNAHSCIFLFEAWTAVERLGEPHIQPSQNPDRKESVVISVDHPDFIAMGAADIKKPVGPDRLGPIQWEQMTHGSSALSGRLVGLVPRGKKADVLRRIMESLGSPSSMAGVNSLNVTEDVNGFDPDWASAPGETIIEVLQERKWSLERFASEASWGLDFVKTLIIGAVRIDKDVDQKLCDLIGGAPGFWVRRDQQYLKALERKKNNAGKA